MVITGINRFFAKHGRIAFFFIAVVIIFTFAFFMTGMSIFDLFGARRGPQAMMILGRKVDRAQRMEAVDCLLIQQALVFPEINLENVDYSRLDRNGVNSLMLSYAAKDRGIAIGDAEVKKYIQSVPAFQTKGKFDVKKFNNFVNEKLKPRHFNKEDLDYAVREKLAIEQLTKDVVDNVIIPDEEIRNAYFNINEKAKVKTAEFNSANYLKKVKMTDKEALSYYEANKDKYQTPSAVKIELVRFEYGKFRKQAYNSISQKEIKDYYEKNKHLYLKKETKPAKKKKKKDAKPKDPEYEPLAKVSGKIQNKLADKKSHVLATKAANKFSEKIYDLTSDIPYNIKDKSKAMAKCREEFVNFAKKQQKTVFTPNWIYDGDTKITGLGEEPELTKAAGTRFLDDPISDAVKGKKAAFVFILTAKKAPKPETFAKRKNKILADLKRMKSVNLAREAAREAALKISEAIDKGQKLEDISKKLKITFKKMPMELTAAYPPFMMPNGQLIHKVAFETPQGQLAPTQETPTGGLLVYVDTKKFPTAKEFETQKAMFSMRYKRMKQQAAWVEFNQTLVAASNTTGKKEETKPE